MHLNYKNKVMNFEEKDNSLIVCSDLQGNYRDFARIVEIAAGSPLLFLGDVIHKGVSDENYEDESTKILDAIIEAPNLFQIIGNHEFMQLNEKLTNSQNSELTPLYIEPFKKMAGNKLIEYLEYFRKLPLIARTPCGVLLSHTGPTEAMTSLEQLTGVKYDSCSRIDFSGEDKADLLGNLLFRKNIRYSAINKYLKIASTDGFVCKIAVYGHVPQTEGFDYYGSNQFTVSTSFCTEENKKTYLFFDLKKRFDSIKDFKRGEEMRLLYGGE